jgi:cyclophilin family peptidyl-prolyl cis-trans isomerase
MNSRQILAAISLFTALTLGLNQSQAASAKAGKDTLVLIETSMGNIKLMLYKETPLHRKNFIKLVSSGFYDSLLFHRVIRGFMIQGGDPQSKRAKAGVALGNGEVGYTLPAEFRDSLIHRRGALAAARLGDDVNPSKASSGCQFYIVQGKTFSASDLSSMEARMNQNARQGVFMSFISRPENVGLRQRFVNAQQSANRDSMEFLSKLIEPRISGEMNALKPYKFSPSQVKAYTTSGGSPHLDGGYTVFGQVVEGMEVIDKISEVEKDPGDRPKQDVRFKARIVIE